MTTLILIRHGESEANRHDIFAGHIDPDLLEKGLEQAEVTAKHIVQNYQVDKIYSSDLQRAYKTALCLAELTGLSVLPEKNLREINAGAWEGIKFDELCVLYPEEYNLWLNHIGRSGCVGGETVRELGDRFMAALTKIARENDGKTVAVATHATPIRCAQSIIESGSVEAMETIPWVTNASITVLEYDDNSWSIRLVGADSHLKDLITALPDNV